MIAKSVARVLPGARQGKSQNMKIRNKTLAPELLRKMDEYWRAANYLSVGQIYLYDNPLLKKPLTLAHVKPRLLGTGGPLLGLNFIYVHLNRVIKQHDLDMIYVSGPGNRPHSRLGWMSPAIYAANRRSAEVH